jgi:hypothetical protein
MISFAFHGPSSFDFSGAAEHFGKNGSSIQISFVESSDPQFRTLSRLGDDAEEVLLRRLSDSELMAHYLTICTHDNSFVSPVVGSI